MGPDELEGQIKNGIGRVEEEAGEVLGDPGLKLRGEARQFEGSAQEALGVAKEAIGKTVQKAREAVSEATDQAAETYQTLRKRAESVATTVDPFVKEQPYIAVMLAAVAGLILGALFAGGGPKVIYVKPAAGLAVPRSPDKRCHPTRSQRTAIRSSVPCGSWSSILRRQSVFRQPGVSREERGGLQAQNIPSGRFFRRFGRSHITPG